MHHLVQLMPSLGHEKTLIITCHECFSNEEHHDKVYFYHCLGNMLRMEDHLQRECIRFYVETHDCRRIIMLGHYDCKVIQRILDNRETRKYSTTMHYNVEALVHEHERGPWVAPSRDRVLVEFNIVEQLRLLLKYDFIAKKVSEGKLLVTGSVLNEQTDRVHEIFRNGISYNHMMAYN